MKRAAAVSVALFLAVALPLAITGGRDGRESFERAVAGSFETMDATERAEACSALVFLGQRDFHEAFMEGYAPAYFQGYTPTPVELYTVYSRECDRR